MLLLRKDVSLFLRLGIAFFLLANSHIAFFSPTEFTEALEKSFLVSLLPFPVSLSVKILFVTDILAVLLLLTGILKKFAYVYAFLWIVLVIIVTGTRDFPDFLEHLGILSFILFAFLYERKVSTLSQEKPASQ